MFLRNKKKGRDVKLLYDVMADTTGYTQEVALRICSSLWSTRGHYDPVYTDYQIALLPLFPKPPQKKGCKIMLAEKKHTYTDVLANISWNTFTGNISKGLSKSVLWTVIK